MSNSIEFTDDGDINYKLWSKQKEAVKLFTKFNSLDIVDYRGGYRSGKSYAGSRAILSLAWSENNSKWAVMAKSYKEGVRSTFEALYENMPNYDGSDPESSPIVKNFHKKDMILTLQNGSKIYLATSENPKGLKGSELSGAWLDETAFYSDLYDILEMVLSRMSAENARGIISTTTTNGFNDYHKIFKEKIHPKKDINHGWNIKTITADVRNNPFLSDEVIERLERTHNNNKEEGLVGGFSADEGRVYPNFNRKDYVVENIEKEQIKENWRLYGMDYGWSDPTVVIEIAKLNSGDLIVLDEFYRSKTKLDVACDWLSDKPYGNIYADHHPREQQRMRDKINKGLLDAEKSKESGVMEVKKYFNHKSDEVPNLYVHERCSQLIGELVGYTKDVLSGNKSGEDHAVDSLRYALYTVPEHKVSENSNNVVTEEDIEENKNDNGDVTFDV